MSDLSPEEEKQILESAPKGTLAIILGYSLIMGLGWLGLYFGRFLAHGPVS